MALTSMVIDDEFRKMIPPLAEMERKQLEENIVRDGCRDPLVVWKQGDTSVLIDGHNRYEICARLGIAFEVTELEFDSRDSAADWIDANQLGRRNLTPEQMSLLRGRRYNRAKKDVGRPEGNADNLSTLRTAEKLAEQHGVDEKTIRRDGKFAEAVEVLGMADEVSTGELSAPKAAIVEAAKPLVEAKKAHDKWQEETKKTPLAPPPEPPLPTVDDVQKAKAHVSHNSGENEWYTPPEFIESARNVFGGVIDCDPASCEVANRTVGAVVYFSKEDNGLEQTWSGACWLNPPYSQPLIRQFSEAVAEKYESGEIDSAIVLVNNATETAWFQRIAEVASAICFPRARIKFMDPQGNRTGAPLQGQAILYLGQNVPGFRDQFECYGWCWGRINN